MAKRAKKRTTKNAAARRTRQVPKLLSDLFLETLKDIYFAENKIIKTLPKMAKAAHSKDLAAAFNKHLRDAEAADCKGALLSEGQACCKRVMLDFGGTIPICCSSNCSASPEFCPCNRKIPSTGCCPKPWTR